MRTELKRVSQVSRSPEGEREGAFSRDERTSNSRSSSLFSVFPAERVGRSRGSRIERRGGEGWLVEWEEKRGEGEKEWKERRRTRN